MAQKLSVQIELAGATEIARQLESLGETGKKAFQEMGAAAEQVGGFSQLDPTDVTEKLKDMGITGVDAINQIQTAVKEAGDLEGIVQGVKQLENGFGALGKVLRPLGGEFRKVQQAATAVYAVLGPIGAAGVGAFAAITTAVTLAAKATIGFADSINKFNNEAIRLGEPVAKLDEFRAGLERVGVSAEGVGQILQSKLASEQGLAGLNAFIRQLEQMPDSVERGKLAVEQFGAAGAELIRILQAGGKLTGLAGASLINPEDAKKATELGVALNQLESSINRLSTVQLAPALTAGINVATAAVGTLGQRMGSLSGTASTLAQGLFTPFQLLTQLVVSASAQLLGLGPAVQQVGQAAQQSGVMFTAWGTVINQSAMTAQVGVQGVGTAAQQAGTMFTSFGTVASQSAAQADASMRQAAGGATTLGTSIQGAAEKAVAFATAMAGITWDAISSVGVAAWNALTGAIGGAATAVADFFSKLASGAWDKVKALLGLGGGGGAPAPASGMAHGGLLGGRGTGTSDSNLAWLSRGEYVVPARAVARPGVLSFLEALRRGSGIPGFAGGGPAGGGDQLWNFLNTVTDQLDGALRELTNGLVNHVFQIAKAVERPMQALLGLMNEIKGKAGGGLLGGRGTGTSDSNLAWVSRGEYIVPARAVARPGTLEFLELLRRSGGNLRAVLDGMGRFALGGLVPRMPAFAAGGLAGGGNHVTIQFPGLPAIGGLRAWSGVVDQLQKAAALAQVRSGGRKPSRYS